MRPRQGHIPCRTLPPLREFWVDHLRRCKSSYFCRWCRCPRRREARVYSWIRCACGLMPYGILSSLAPSITFSNFWSAFLRPSLRESYPHLWYRDTTSLSAWSEKLMFLRAFPLARGPSSWWSTQTRKLSLCSAQPVLPLPAHRAPGISPRRSHLSLPHSANISKSSVGRCTKDLFR